MHSRAGWSALVMVVFLACSATGSAPRMHEAPAGDGVATPSDAYAYWLDDANVARYVDLLIAPQPIAMLRGDAEQRPGSWPAVVVTTYQKDSLWNMDGHPFRAVERIADLDPATHGVRINGKHYRYSEASLADVIRLLRHPEGTIPIARIKAPLEGAENQAAALLERLERAPE